MSSEDFEAFESDGDDDDGAIQEVGAAMVAVPPARPEPEISAGYRPSGIPPAIYRMQRSAAVRSEVGTQHVFHGPGITHFVSGELMPEEGEEDDYNNEPNPGQPQQVPGMRRRGLDDEGPNYLQRTPDEEARFRETQEHAFNSAKKIAYATATRTHTPGSKRVSRTMRRQMETYSDVRWKIDNDDEAFGWHPAPSPDINRLHKFIGKFVTDEDSECFGCQRGIGMERVKHSVMLELKDFITESFGRMQLDELCLQTHEWFEDNIRARFNSNLAKGQNEIPQWTVPSIFEHITMHCTESTFIHWEMLKALVTEFRVLRDNALYKVKVEALNSGRELGYADMYPSQIAHKMMLETINAILHLEGKDPKMMANYNKNFAMASNVMGAVGSKRPQIATQLSRRSIYEPVDSGIS
jgi:hypothetical protein